ncbi:MAG: PDZ domain-containing protein [Acidobacteriaceae bacterium]
MRGQRAYGILLSLIAAAILVIGFLLKPPPTKGGANKRSPEFTNIQNEVDRLREIAQRNSLKSTSARFSAAANDAARHSVLLLPSNRPAWMIGPDGVFIAASDGAPASDLRGSQGGTTTPVMLLTWGAGLPYLTGRYNADLAPSPPNSVSLDQVSPGSWILLVSRNASGAVIFSPGNYSGQSQAECGLRRFPILLSNIPLENNALGAGIFDFDGNFLALVVRCEGQLAAIPVAALRQAANSQDEGLLATLHWGFRAWQVSADSKSAAKAASQVTVSDVWRSWPADNAGLAPGDAIIRANDVPVRSLNDFESLVGDARDMVVLEVQRGRRRMRIELSSDEIKTSAVQLQHEGLELESVSDGSSVAEAGLRAGDRILSVNGANPAPQAVERLLGPVRVNAPVQVVAQRGARKFAVAVEP